MLLKKFLNSLLPFVFIGGAIAIFISLILMFFTIAVWGLIIGSVLWIGAVIKLRFFTPKPPPTDSGRVIEHDRRS